MICHFKVATMAAIFSASLGTVVNATQVHQGEDGKLYNLTEISTAITGTKIEQDLFNKVKTNSTVDIIIYLEGNSLKSALKYVDNKNQLALKDLSRKLALIEDKYRPSESLPEKDEIAFVRSNAAKMSSKDSQLALDIKTEIDTLQDKMRADKASLVNQATKAQLDKMGMVLKSMGAKVNHKIALSNAISASIPSSMLQQIADYPGVRFVQLDRPAELELNVTMPSAGFPTWHPDIDGGVHDFGIVDSGVREDHPAFTSGGINFCSKAGSSVTGDHGTHVAGIVASNNATYKGTAYGLDTVIWANSGNQSTTMSNMQWMVSGSCQGPDVVNHSLGYGRANDVDYSASDAFYDAFVSTYNVMVTKSTGNSGWRDNRITITHPAPAYNLMAVANMRDTQTTTRDDDVRNHFSSVGPTLNGRKKPDIIAPGTSIMSTNSNWATGNEFISKSGTSMAAPHVAGAIILMKDGGNHIPMAQKAVLINTADAWTSKNTRMIFDDVQLQGSHWDKSYGWGYLDMSEAYFNRGDYFVDSVTPNNDNATADDYKLYKGKMLNNEKATLVWQRRADVIAGPLGNGKILTDLNVRLYAEGNNTALDSELDAINNVHQVAANATIDAVIKVYSWSTTFDDATSESYALATEENFAAATPPALAIPAQNFSGPSNSNVSINVNVSNNGDVNTCDVTVTRAAVAGVSGTTTVTIGSIADASSSSAAFTLSANAGTYTIPYTATTTCYDETYTTSGSITFTAN